MKLCEFCIHQNAGGNYAACHPPPQKTRCVDFTPSIERFCATLADYMARAA